jgi:protein-S-isoprenylcysteine O-methyltransferase Ste14
MARTAHVAYGLACYAFFLVTFLYAIGFVTGFVVPKAINDGPVVPLADALAVNLTLLTVFAVQHSGMARRGFKRWWLARMPAPTERPTYVLLATAALALLMWQWRPMPEIVWRTEGQVLTVGLRGLEALGWLIVLSSTFMISHFELFGVKQVVFHALGRSLPRPEFKAPLLYGLVRHPIYLGFLIAFWATPDMTQGHLLFAIGTTGYILFGILLEERDLVAFFGDDYRRYRDRVGMLLPRWRRA